MLESICDVRKYWESDRFVAEQADAGQTDSMDGK